MSSWTIPGLKPPVRSYYSAPREPRMNNAHKAKVGCFVGGRSRKRENQFPLRLYSELLSHQSLPCTSGEGRKGRKGILEPNVRDFPTPVQASLDNGGKQDNTDINYSTGMDEELRRSECRFAPFCSNIGGPSRGRALMNYAFGGGYERDIIHKEIVRRLNSVGAAHLDKSEGFYVRSTAENVSFISADFDHGPDDIVALEEDRYRQLGREQGIVEDGISANTHAMKKRRVPLKEHDEQGRWARRSLLNHCIPAILEKLGFNFSSMNLAASQGLSSLYNVNVTVSYEMKFQPVAEEGFVNQSETGKGSLKQDRKLSTTDSIRQVARPVNFLSSKGNTGSKINVTQKAVNQLDYGKSPSLRANLYLDSQMTVPNPITSGVRGRGRSPGRLWLQADSDSNAPQSNMWRDLFTIIGLSAFIICGTYAFAVSNRYLKFGSRNKPTSMTTRGHCGSDPHSATTLKQPGVIELINCNFEIAVSKKPTFVLFYAPWCSHCQQLEHTWRDLACRLPKKGYDVQLAQMDAEKYSQMAEKFKVVKYPTLILFKDGKPTDSHTGPRDLDSLMTFIDENYM